MTLLLTLALLLPPLAAASLTGERRRGPSLPSPPRLADVPNSVRHVLASAASGAVGVTTLAPLEVMRVNMMVSGRGWSLRRAFASLEGGWYRGNSADVLAAAIRVGITMPAFATYKRLLQRASEEGSSSSPPPEWTVLAAGALAGCTASIACYPLEARTPSLPTPPLPTLPPSRPSLPLPLPRLSASAASPPPSRRP